MAAMKWQQDMETGIGLIDDQHKVIVDYVNRLGDAISALDSTQVEDVLGKFAAYLKHHFAFEERLQQNAGYPFLEAHRRLHLSFFARLESYRERFRRGEDVTGELGLMLSAWLVDHLKHDDRDYVPAVSDFLRHKREERLMVDRSATAVQKQGKAGRGVLARINGVISRNERCETATQEDSNKLFALR